jgi:hypothetical protein
MIERLRRLNYRSLVSGARLTRMISGLLSLRRQVVQAETGQSARLRDDLLVRNVPDRRCNGKDARLSKEAGQS